MLEVNIIFPARTARHHMASVTTKLAFALDKSSAKEKPNVRFEFI